MTVAPSCPVLVVHEDDAFRRSLIASLDRHNFSVTFADDPEAIPLLARRKGAFRVVVVGVKVSSGTGLQVLEHLRHHCAGECAVIIVGDPDPGLRTCAPWVDETLMKPVDPEYVSTRARVYCGS